MRGLEGGRRDESSKHPHPCKISVKYPHPSTGWPGSNVTEKSCRQRDTHTGGGVRGMNPQVGLRGMNAQVFLEWSFRIGVFWMRLQVYFDLWISFFIRCDCRFRSQL